MPLPPGLTLNRLTGAITGTPTEAGSFSTTLRVRDSSGFVRDVPITIVIAEYTPPSLAGDMDTYATKGSAYNDQLTASNGVPPYTWSIPSGTIPTGISLNTGTGQLSGTPTSTSYGDRALTIRVVDSAGGSAQYTWTMKYAAALAAGSGYPGGFVGTAYSSTSGVTGGHLPLTFAVESGSIPSGLLLNTATGLLSGTPDTAATYPATIRVTDQSGASIVIPATITVAPAYTPVSVSGSITGASATYAKASGSYTISPSYAGVSVSGGNGSYTYSWARISGSTAISAVAPSSLATGFSSSVAPGSSGSSVFRCTISDGVSSATIDVTVSATNTYVAPSLSGSVAEYAMRTRAYSASSFTVSNGTAPYSWAVSSGTLPTGITLNSSTGVISGTPTNTSYGDRSITIRVTDSEGQQATRSFTLHYADNLALSGTPSPAYKDEAYSFTPTTSGGFSAISYALQSGTLPAGLSLNTSTGAVTGTPSATHAGAAITIRATDAQGYTADLATTIAVYLAPSLSGTLTARATRSVAYSSGITVSNGAAPFTWSIAAGTLPTGLTINTSTGVISGTPTDTSYTTRAITVRVTDAGGKVVDSTQSITYRDFPDMVASTLPTASRTVPYTQPATAANAASTHALTYSLQSGTLPAGLTLGSGTGSISGTPTSTSYSNIALTIRATDPDGNYDEAVKTLPYIDLFSITPSFGGGTEGTAYSGSATASGGVAPITYSVNSGSLPPGTTLNTSTGAVTGTPTTPGNYSFVIRATDSAAQFVDTSTQNVAIANTINVNDHSASHTHTSNANPYIQINSAGTVTLRNSGESTAGEWKVSGASSDFEVRGTILSGPTKVTGSGGVISSGTFGTWLVCGGDIQFGMSVVDGSGSTEGEMTILLEFRRAGGTGVILDSCTVSLSGGTF